MVEISYNTVMDVVTSWDRLKAIPNYQDKTGNLILERLFELEPASRAVFGLSCPSSSSSLSHSSSSSLQTSDLLNDPKIAVHAIQMVEMMDCAIALLGPDLDDLKHDLARLGRRHVQYGVKPRFLPVMESAVVYALEEMLDDKFTRNDRRSWQQVFYFMVSHMTEGMSSSK